MLGNKQGDRKYGDRTSMNEMNRLRILIVCHYLVICSAMAQPDSTMQLTGPSVHISTSVYSDQLERRLDTSRSIVEALNGLADLQIQQLSPGLLATALTGGSAGRHLSILWDGWNIQSPINGTFDLSLLPASLYDGTSYLDRSLQQATGSAAHRGGLLLDQARPRHHTIYTQIDSWGDVTVGGGTHYQTGVHKIDIRAQARSQNLNYPYDRFGERTIQSDAQADGIDVTAAYTAQLRPATTIKVKAWHQKSERQLSPSKTATYRGDEQTDRNTRISTALQHNGRQIVWKWRSAYFDEYIYYRTPGIDSKARNYASMTSVSAATLHQHTTSLEIMYRQDIVRSSFDINETRRTTSLVLRQKAEFSDRLYAQLLGRIDRIDNSTPPLAATMAIHYEPINHWTVDADYSLSYTYPSLNDLYWPALGNADLRTERGHSISLSSTYARQVGPWQIKTGMHLQRQQIKDWIIWQPQDNGQWQPNNQQGVENRSVRLQTSFDLRLGKTNSISLSLEGYVASNKVTADNIYPERIGSQMAYLPTRKATAQANYQHGKWAASINMQHTGSRYIVVGSDELLSAYTLYGCSVSCMITDGLTILFQGDNLTGTVYEIAPFQPTALQRMTLRINVKL